MTSMNGEAPINYPVFKNRGLLWVHGETLLCMFKYLPLARVYAVAALHYEPGTFCRLFRRIGDFYDQRVANKGTILDPILKLAMNSVYGKTGAHIHDTKVFFGMNAIHHDTESPKLQEESDTDIQARLTLWEAYFGTKNTSAGDLENEQSDEMPFPPIKNMRVHEKLNVMELNIDDHPEERVSNTQGLIYIAALVTARARNIYLSMAYEANSAGCIVLYGDTDSLVLWAESEDIIPFLNEEFNP